MYKKRWYVLAVFMLMLIGVAVMFNTTWLAEFVTVRVLASKPGVVVRRVHIAHQQFSLPGRLELQQIDLALEVNGKMLTLQAPQVLITGLQTSLSSDRRILAAMENMTVRYDLGQAKEARADLTLDRDGIRGPLTAFEAGWDKLRARDVSLFLIVNSSEIELRAVKLAAYGGRITGKVFMPIKPAEKTGTYAAELFTDGLDLARLAEINPEIAVQLNGVVTGTLKIEGDPTSLRTVDTDLVMPTGGKISASLLAALTQYLPKSQEKKRLDVLIRKGGKIALEAFSFTIKGGEAGKFAGNVHLMSREINLELNLEHEINTDGTIASLFGYWETFFH